MEILIGIGKDAVISEFGTYIQDMMGIVVLVSIPFLVFAAAYCFFGIKIFRVLLVISGVFGGGVLGALLLGLATQSTGGAVAGCVLIGVVGGLLAWYVYKLVLFIEAFFAGFIGMGLLLIILTGSVPAALIIGFIIGMALGVLICIYTKLFVMIMTAYRGASTIAFLLSLLFITTGAYKAMNVLLLAAFIAAGIVVQYKFFFDESADNAGVRRVKNIEKKQAKEKKGSTSGYMLVGIDGMYKGFEFDLDDGMVFGRDAESCNVIFPDTCPGVSRIQCQIMYDSKMRSASIVDKYSSYGTTLNGNRLEINRTMPLTEGDVVMFGENNIFKFIRK